MPYGHKLLPLLLILLLSPLHLSAEATDSQVRLSLEECIQRALQLNPQIDVASFQVKAAESKEGEAKGGELPRFEVLDIFGAVPEARGDVLNSPDKTTDIDGLGPFNRIEVNITQPVFTFGRLRSLIEAAEYGLQAQIAKKEMTKQDVIFEVKKLYYNVLLTRDLIDLLSEIKEHFEEAIEKAEELLEAESEKVSQTDILKLKLGANQIEQEYSKLAHAEPLALAALKQAIGIEKDADFDIRSDHLSPESVDLHSLDRYIEKTFQHRPEWKALQAGIEAKEALLKAEKKTPYPAFFVSGLFRYAVAPNRDDQKNPFVYDEFNFIEAGAFLGFRLNFDFGHDDRVAGARAQLDELVAQREQARFGFPVEVQKSWLAVQEKGEQLELAKEARRQARTLLGLTATHYELGLGEAKEIFEALEFFTKALSNYYLTIHDYNLALAELSKVTGEEATDLRY